MIVSVKALSASSVIALVLTITSCISKKETISIESILLDHTSISLNEGEEVTLHAVIIPDNASEKNILWSSSDKHIVTVSKNGTVTAIMAGNATISASAGDILVNCNVEVLPLVIPVSDVLLSKASLSLIVGEEETLGVSLYPENTTEKNITWSSSDDSIAAVKDGTIKARKEGTAIVSASIMKITDECLVIVDYIPVAEIQLVPAESTLYSGEKTKITTVYSPVNATYKNVTWESSEPSVVSVDDNGFVKANNPGTAVISAINRDRRAEINMNVLVPVSAVSINPSSASIFTGNSLTLNAQVLPEGVVLKKPLLWTSSNSSIATVSDNGVVRGIAAGNATISVVAGNKDASIPLTVLNPGDGNEEIGEEIWK